jgi:hypothetical protein
MPATTGMKGAGYFDRNSSAQMSAIQSRLGAEPERYLWNFTLVATLLTRC